MRPTDGEKKSKRHRWHPLVLLPREMREPYEAVDRLDEWDGLDFWISFPAKNTLEGEEAAGAASTPPVLRLPPVISHVQSMIVYGVAFA